MKILTTIAAALLLATTACGDLSTNPSAQLAGDYQLRTMNNAAVPATLFYNSSYDHVEVLAGTLRVYDDGTYTNVTTVRDTYNGSTTTYDDNTSGFWTLSGNSLTLQDRYDSGKISVAYVGNNRITFDNFSGYAVTAVYLK